MLKRAVLVLLIAVLVLPAVFAGGGAARNDGTVTLRMSWWGGDVRHVAYLDAIKVYETSHPNVKIEGEYQAWDGYQQKVWTQIASGAQADIIQLDAPWFPELSQMGDIFVDYYAQQIMDISGFDQEFMKFFGEWNGKLIGVPAGVNSNNLLHNKSAADELNLNFDEFWKEPYTYDRFLQAGQALRSSHPDKYLFTADVGGYLITFVRTRLKQLSGKQLYNPDFTRGFTEQQLAVTYDYCVRMQDLGVGSPIQEAELYKGRIEQSPVWVNSNALIAFDWSSAVSRYQGTLPAGKQVVSLRLPVDANGANKNSQVVRPNFMYSIKKTSQGVDAALELLDWWMNSVESTQPLNDTRGVNVTEIQRKRALEVGVANAESSKIVEIGMKAKLPDENPLSTNTELDALMRTQLSKAMFKEMTPAACAAETCRLLDQKLAELKAAGVMSAAK